MKLSHETEKAELFAACVDFSSGGAKPGVLDHLICSPCTWSPCTMLANTPLQGQRKAHLVWHHFSVVYLKIKL